MTQISEDERISADVANQVGIAVESGIDFVSADAIRAAAQEAGRDAVATDALVENYQQAPLRSQDHERLRTDRRGCSRRPTPITITTVDPVKTTRPAP